MSVNKKNKILLYLSMVKKLCHSKELKILKIGLTNANANKFIVIDSLNLILKHLLITLFLDYI